MKPRSTFIKTYLVQSYFCLQLQITSSLNLNFNYEFLKNSDNFTAQNFHQSFSFLDVTVYEEIFLMYLFIGNIRDVLIKKIFYQTEKNISLKFKLN